MEYTYDIALSFATENQGIVEKVYHYLKQEGVSVFFAPAPECQVILSGENQREIFFSIFGLKSKFVALFVSKDYVIKEVPMEEASIAFAKHGKDNTVIPVYLDGTKLPNDLLDPIQVNYFSSNSAAVIATHLAEKVKNQKKKERKEKKRKASKYDKAQNIMNITGNSANKQIFIQEMKGKIWE